MKTFRIIILLLLPMIGAGQNISINREEYKSAAPAAAFSELKSADMNDNVQVNNFDERAIQKLKDFYNYLTIISNQSYNNKMREEAKKQALKLFSNTNCAINGQSVRNFIDSCADKIKSNTEWKALEISINKIFAQQPDDTTTTSFNGELLFKVSVNGAVSAFKKAQMNLTKERKQFGKRREDLWTVYLCDISDN